MKLKQIKRIVQGVVLAFKSKKYIPYPIINQELLKGKIALITGGSGGIGYAIAKAFVRNGCKVIIAGTNWEKLNKLVNDIDVEKVVLLNLSDCDDITKGVYNAIECFGHIDILVNSAGIHSSIVFDNFLEVKEKDFDSIMDINLKGTYFITQQVAKHMIKNKIHGHILNISSSTDSEPAWSPYRLSKWGIKGMTLGFAQQLQEYGIVVNSIAPGSTATSLLGYKGGDSIWTDENRSHRFILPDEIACYATLMVSDLGNMIVGDTLYLSGGRGIIDIR